MQQTLGIVISHSALAGSVSKATLEVKCQPRVFLKTVVEQMLQDG